MESCRNRQAPLRRGAFFLAGLLVLGSGAARAVTTGDSDVVLQANATVEIEILDASVTLAPDQTDYEAGFVVAEGAAGIAVQVRTNSSTGMSLAIKCADGDPEIALADLLFKTATAAGGGGDTIDEYTAITGVDQVLWTTDQSSSDWTTIDTDIQVKNLWVYEDAGGGGVTEYTNTLTYTITVQ